MLKFCQNSFSMCFKDLCTKDESVCFVWLTIQESTRKAASKTIYGKIILKEECYDAIMTLKLGRTPGSDELTLAFFCKFWTDMKDPLYNMSSEVVNRGLNNPSRRRGNIKLIPKKSIDGLLIKNWRPITLLNYDYKIWRSVGESTRSHVWWLNRKIAMWAMEVCTSLNKKKSPLTSYWWSYRTRIYCRSYVLLGFGENYWYANVVIW